METVELVPGIVTVEWQCCWCGKEHPANTLAAVDHKAHKLYCVDHDPDYPPTSDIG